MNNLADNAINDLGGDDVAGKSPIETVFKLNLRNGLLEFEKHFEHLNSELDTCI